MSIYAEGGINYENKDGQIYKNNVLVPETNYQYIPSAIGGSRDGASTFTPTATTPTEQQKYVEGGITYENIGGQVYKNGTLVDPSNYKYIPQQVGGTRQDVSTTPQGSQYIMTDEDKQQYNNLSEAQLREMASQNSAAWHNATPEEKARLQSINQYIMGGLLGEQFNSGTGTWAAQETGGGEVGGGVEGGQQGGQTGPIQYNDQYGNMVNEIVKQITERMGQGFQYDPSTDRSLQEAQKHVAKSTMEQMNTRGILNSTITQDTIAEHYTNLTAQYEQIARGQFNSETDRLMAFGSFLGNLDQNNFNKAVTMWEADMQERQFEYRIESDRIDRAREDETISYNRERQSVMDAWDRVNELGYVDNASAGILGVPVGTLSGRASELVQKRIWDLDDQHTARLDAINDEQRALQNSKSLFDYKLTREAEMINEKEDALKPTNQQEANYLYLKNAFLSDEQTPQEIFKYMSGIEQTYIGLMGEQLYEQLKEDIRGKTFEEEPQQETYFKKGTSDYSGYISHMVDNASNYPTAKGKTNYVVRMRSEIISVVGIDGYNDLLDLVDPAGTERLVQ